MSDSPILQLRAFGVAYGERTVLREVTVDVAASGCTVLLGPSGTGKSTLLRTLAGYNRKQPQVLTWGEALYGGAPCTEEHHPVLVMQHPRLLVSNVLENLVCELPARSTLTRRMQLDVISALLAECECCHLMERLDDKVVERPISEQRIIAILRLAAAEPRLLMVDEPTAGLKPPEADKVLNVLERLARRRAVLVVLHNLKEARRLAQDVVLLANGKVQESQPVDGFFGSPRSECGRVFVQSGSCPEMTESEALAAATAPTTPAPAPRSVAAEAVSAACGPRGFVWLLPGQLAGTPWPGIVHGAQYDLQALRAVGITYLVSLTEEPFDQALAAAHGISCLSYPMPDMHPPTMEQGMALCRKLDALLAQGEVPAVHCRAGLGRTGTVLACYWLWLGRGSLSAVKALEDVRRLEPGWVQSAAQVSFLEQFADLVAGAAAPSARPAQHAADTVTLP